MNVIASSFWNHDERRLRAGWRVAVQSLAMILVAVIWQFNIPGRAGVATLSGIGTLLLSLLVVIGARRVLDRRSAADLGLRLDCRWWLEGLAGFVLGAVLIGGVFICEWGSGWIAIRPAVPDSGMESAPRFIGAMVLLYYVAVGVFEEAYFRGYLLRNLADGMRCRRVGEQEALILAGAVTSIVFAAAHVHSPGFRSLSWLNTLLAGVLLAYLVFVRGNLAAAIGFHIGWDYLQGMLGFAVSGGLTPRSWFRLEQAGPDVWTGGAYGPEGGLLGTLAFAIGLLIVATHHLISSRYDQKRIANDE